MSSSLIDERQFSEYMDALMQGDIERCRGFVQRLLDANISLEDLYFNLFHRSQYAVGDLWEINKCSVAMEHLVTSITETLMTLAYPRLFNRPHIGKTAIISCGCNQYHQIGGKMVADIFELHGWHGHFLGANTPERQLFEEIRDKSPDVLAFSVAVPFAIPGLVETLRKISNFYPGLTSLVGGRAAAIDGPETFRNLPNVRLMTSLRELEEFLAPQGGL